MTKILGTSSASAGGWRAAGDQRLEVAAMSNEEINRRLVQVGETIKAKGWVSASIDIYVSYLAIFDLPPTDRDPMISYRPSIRTSTRAMHGTPTQHEFVRDSWDVKSLEEALAKLEGAAYAMPTMADEESRIAQAKSKLSAKEKALLGIR